MERWNKFEKLIKETLPAESITGYRNVRLSDEQIVDLKNCIRVALETHNISQATAHYLKAVLDEA